MPVNPSYPGVYIQEVASGVRTITGVATSITAFVGTAIRGPTDEPATITSYADFERIYDGLGENYPMSYAVKDYFRNGGSVAIIVRLFRDDPNGNPSKATIDIPDLKLEAASRGSWGMKLRARVESVPDDENRKAVAGRLGMPSTKDLFDLTIRDGNNDAVESHMNLTTKESVRRADRVLKAESTLVRCVGTPSATDKPVGHGEPQPGDDIWALEALSTPADKNKVATDSAPLTADDYKGKEVEKKGLYQLEKVDLFNLMCIFSDKRDADVLSDVYREASSYCVKRRAFLLVDSIKEWALPGKPQTWLETLALTGERARNAALFWPWIKQADPKRGGAIETFPSSGMIAGVMARTDAQRGVWKAPAGIDATLDGATGLQTVVTDGENGLLNPLAINTLRAFPVYGTVVWGARTLRGADVLGDEYRYIPVRRTALFIEESLYRGLKWVVFEPNDEPLWSQIRLNVGAFMHDLFRKGAFQGLKPQDAYFVKCDRETTTQNDINLGIVNIWVGFAPLKPAEFVILHLQQIAGKDQS